MLEIVFRKYVLTIACLLCLCYTAQSRNTGDDKKGIGPQQQVAIGQHVLNAREIDSLNKVIMRNPKLKEPYVTRAFYHLGNNNQSEALADINKALSIDGNYFAALHLMGYIHYNNGEKEKAKAYFEKAVKSEPNFAFAHQGLALCLEDSALQRSEIEKAYYFENNDLLIASTYALILVRANELYKADNILKRFEKNEDYTAQHYYFRSTINLEIGDTATALSIIQKGIERYGRHTVLLKGLIEHYEKTKEYKRAEEILVEYKDIMPGNCAIDYNLAELKMMEGDTAAAIELFTKYGTACSTNTSFAAVAAILIELKAYDGSLSLLRRAEAAHEDDTVIVAVYALLMLRGEEFETADSLYNILIAMEPQNVIFRYNKLIALMNIDEFGDALKQCDTINMLYPEMKGLNWYYMLAHRYLYNYQAAAAYAAKYIEEDTTVIAKYLHVGRLHLEMNDKLGSKKYIDIAIAKGGITKDALSLYLAWMNYFSDYGKMDEIEKTIPTEKNNEPEIMFWFARNLVSQKKFKNALTYYDQAIAVSPEEGEYYYYRAAARIFSGDNTGGCNDLYKAVKFGYEDAKNSIKSNCK